MKNWITEGDTIFPIEGELKVTKNIPNGIYQVTQSINGRLGLKFIESEFKFNYEVYDLDFKKTIETIICTWGSEIFTEQKRDLGVIFNGIKGTGKTVAAKVLCNTMNLPVITVPDNIKGIVEFIHDIDFECVVLIDEAEKLFNEDECEDDILLRLIESSYNKSRKLYVLTTNELNISENLLGRPGRIRYIKEFGNLGIDTVKKYIEDNLIDKRLSQKVLDVVGELEYSTIDSVRCIVDEFNIYGECNINSSELLNLPKSSYLFKVILFNEEDEESIEDLTKKVLDYFSKTPKDLNKWLYNKRSDGKRNMEVLEEDMRCYITRLKSQSETLSEGMTLDESYVVIKVIDPDKGLYLIRNKYSSTLGSLILVIDKDKMTNLYSDLF